jgi:uncharacterized membrane protein YhaH (DUF805 family)
VAFAAAGAYDCAATGEGETMDFMTAVRTCLQKYADFEGRAARPEFWWFVLFGLIVSTVGEAVFRHWIMALVNLALFVPTIAAGSRRLHDIGKSGWLQLLGIIPVIGWAILIYWAAQPGQPGANEYGHPPGEGASPPGSPGQQP